MTIESESIEQELEKMLQELVYLTRQLVEAFHKEKKCLIENNVIGLKEVNGKEMVVSGLLREADVKRNKLLMHFAEKYGMKQKHIRLSELIQLVAEPYKSSYKKCAMDLKGCISDLVKVRAHNNMLLEKMIKFNDRNIRLFMSYGKKDLTYDNKGVYSKSDKSILNSVI